MPGSLKYFVYETDIINGSASFCIKLDEGNTEAVNGADGDYTGTPPILFEIPKNLRPRVAYYKNSVRSISIEILSPDTEPPATITDPVNPDDGTMNLISVRGERLRRPVGVDTGQTDGDNT